MYNKVKDCAKFQGSGISYKSKLIGIMGVSDDRGDRLCQVAFQCLRNRLKASGQHKQRIIITVSLYGIKITNSTDMAVLQTHPVDRISFISSDVTDNRAFGYIYGPGDRTHKFFAIKTPSYAERLVLVLRDLFLFVYDTKMNAMLGSAEKMTTDANCFVDEEQDRGNKPEPGKSEGSDPFVIECLPSCSLPLDSFTPLVSETNHVSTYDQLLASSVCSAAGAVALNMSISSVEGCHQLAGEDNLSALSSEQKFAYAANTACHTSREEPDDHPVFHGDTVPPNSTAQCSASNSNHALINVNCMVERTSSDAKCVVSSTRDNDIFVKAPFFEDPFDSLETILNRHSSLDANAFDIHCEPESAASSHIEQFYNSIHHTISVPSFTTSVDSYSASITSSSNPSPISFFDMPDIPPPPLPFHFSVSLLLPPPIPSRPRPKAPCLQQSKSLIFMESLDTNMLFSPPSSTTSASSPITSSDEHENVIEFSAKDALQNGFDHVTCNFPICIASNVFSPLSTVSSDGAGLKNALLDVSRVNSPVGMCEGSNNNPCLMPFSDLQNLYTYSLCNSFHYSSSNSSIASSPSSSNTEWDLSNGQCLSRSTAIQEVNSCCNNFFHDNLFINDDHGVEVMHSTTMTDALADVTIGSIASVQQALIGAQCPPLVFNLDSVPWVQSTAVSTALLVLCLHNFAM